MKYNFIKTSDKDIASNLRTHGFTAIAQEGDIYVFLNDGKYQFSADEQKKIVKTDILSI